MDDQRALIFARVVDVIAWELNAQVGVGRPLEGMPTLLADTLLDFFDIQEKPGVVFPGGAVAG